MVLNESQGLRREVVVTEKQKIFHASVAHYDQVGFGGSRGGGKSFSLCHEALRQCLYYPGNVGAIVRRDLVDLKDTTYMTMVRDVLPMYPEMPVTQRGGNRPETVIDFGGGVESLILWRDTKDEQSLMSANLGFFAIDEAVEVSEEFVLMILAALGRRRLADGTLAPKKLFWASNPGPGWCKRWFAVGHQATLNRAGGITRAFVPALPRDNPNLPPGYEEDLRAQYPAIWVKRFLDGDWDAFEGQVFDEFEDARHVLPYGVDLSEFGWPTYLGHDWGFRNPAAAVLASVDFDGDWWFWREYRASGRTPVEHLPHLRAMTEGVEVDAYLIDPAAVDQSTGVAIGEQYMAMGMPFMGWSKAKHGPDGSIMFFKRLLREGKVHISPECQGLITELKEAKWQELSAAMAEKSNPVERMVDKNDHSIDAAFGCLEYWREKAAEGAGVRRAERAEERRWQGLYQPVKLRRRDEYGRPKMTAKVVGL